MLYLFLVSHTKNNMFFFFMYFYELQTKHTLSMWLQSKSRNPPLMRMQKRKKKKHTKGRNKCTKNKMVSWRIKKEMPNTHAEEQPTFSEILTWATLDRRQERGRQTDTRQRGKADHTHTRWRQSGQGGLIKQVCIQKGSQERKKVRTK